MPTAQHEACLGRLVEAVIDAAGDDGHATLTTDEELAAAAYSHAAGLLLETMASALAGGGSWPDRWEAAVRDVVELMRRRPGLARLALVETEGSVDAIRERRMLHRHRFIELLRVERARGEEPELSDVHLELMAGAVYRAFHDEAISGRLMSDRADVVPRLVAVMAIVEPVAA